MKKKIVLDCDGVVLNWYGSLCKKFKRPVEVLYDWDGTEWIKPAWDEIVGDEDFWSNIESLVSPSEINFDFEAWLTHCPEDMVEARKYNLKKLGFPTKKIFTDHSKLNCMIENDYDVLVDDKPLTVDEINDSFSSTGKIAIRFQPYYYQLNGKHIKDLRLMKSIMEEYSFDNYIDIFEAKTKV